jgi:molybdate transport system regulatory protein
LNIIVTVKCARALLYLTSKRIRPRFKLWLVGEDEEYVFGLGTMRLLAEIKRLGSISAAARELGMSYRYALERLTIVEKRLGRPLVDRTRGGKDGGGAKLTAFGYELLEGYRGMEGSLNQLTKWYIDLSDG